MLTGEAQYQLDDRFRVALPRDYRELMEHGGFMTRGWYGCVFLYPWEEWRRIEDLLKTFRLTDMNGDAVKQFFSGGSKVFPDRQGRVNISAALREYAGITDEVIVRGVFNRIELWSKNRWIAYQAQQLSPERIVEKAAALGI